MKKLFVILPCYNEEENISDLVLEWINQKNELLNKGFELNIYPIDDGSKDNTKDIILNMENEHEEVHPIIHEVNKGLGGGVLTGLTYFNKNSNPGDYAVIMDADNTHNPKYIFSMLEKSEKENLDCVIASRYCKSSTVVGVPAFRNFLSFGARVYYSIILQVKNVKDYTCGYRIYSHSIIKKAHDIYGDDMVKERGFSCMMEVLYKLYKVGARFGEVPFELRYDFKKGESKMQISNTVKSSFLTAFKLRTTVKKK